MMQAFFEDFSDRKRQIRHYLGVVLSAERLSGLGASRSQERRLLTLRGGTFLLLYNLVEASTRGAIEAIHDRIATERVSFEALTLQLRSEMVRRFKQGANPAVHHTLKGFPSAFVGVALDQGVTMAGNVDARYIRDLGDVYGFSCATTAARTWGGADLLTIKNQRNALSHGRATFEEVGRDYPSTELVALSRRSLTFMREILDNVATYLDSEGYLEPVPAELLPVVEPLA